MATNNAANQSTAGVQSKTSAGTFNGRTITGTANQITVTNGNGTAGNPTLSLTSTIQVTGISFDSGSNTLSNYSTGTFTPTVTNTGTAPTVTYTTQVGRYTRIGNKVCANLTIALASYTAGTLNAALSALPITSNNTANNNNIGVINIQSTTFGASVIYYVGRIVANSTSITMDGMRSASAILTLTAAALGASSSFGVTVVYEV